MLEDLLTRKIRQCRVLFDFTKSLSEVSQKEIKRESLLELVEYFMTERGFLTPNIYKEVVDMVRAPYEMLR
jgi:serine/threonine-protein phosphatase 2A regulatory subunit B'